MKKLILIVLSLLILISCNKKKKKIDDKVDMDSNLKGKKVLHIDSYDTSFEWSAEIKSSIEKIITENGIEYKYYSMDTKRNTEEEFKKNAALKAKQLIEDYKPDVIIANDDNASKYLIAPYYKNASIPFIFCGVNWNSDIYGFPFDNVTGMEEVTLVPQTIEQLKKYSKGKKIGFLAADTLSENKNLEYIVDKFDVKFDVVYMIETYDDFTVKYKKIQDEVDMLVFYNYIGIKGWDDEKGYNFVYENTKIPSGTLDVWVAKYTLLGFVKTGLEQGEWAAEKAIEILNGKNPKDIPITQNVKGKVILNMKFAKKLNIIFDEEILKNSELISAE